MRVERANLEPETRSPNVEDERWEANPEGEKDPMARRQRVDREERR
jgi:hypothetical protein